jgi:uroporphyrinogen decarboxylase
MANTLHDSLFIRSCHRQPVTRTPVWIMRQAGRYLPPYQALRQKYDFATLYKTPELAAEVTLQPVDVLGVDAAIIFSDILVLPAAMGMSLTFHDAKGPQFATPLRDENELAKLQPIDAQKFLFLPEAIKLVHHQLAGRVPLIGFCGAPWTVAAFMVEGGSAREFHAIKQWRFARPDLLHNLLQELTTATIIYCQAQLEAGADALQIFDPSAGQLDEAGFKEFALPYVNEILRAIRRPGVPLIFFSKGTGQWLSDLASVEADVIALDWTVSLATARRLLGAHHAVQGNLDPCALRTPLPAIRQAVARMLQEFGYGHGHIVNLGHGILPDTPVEHAQAFVAAVKELSPQFHGKVN